MATNWSRQTPQVSFAIDLRRFPNRVCRFRLAIVVLPTFFSPKTGYSFPSVIIALVFKCWQVSMILVSCELKPILTRNQQPTSIHESYCESLPVRALPLEFSANTRSPCTTLDAGPSISSTSVFPSGDSLAVRTVSDCSSKCFEP